MLILVEVRKSKYKYKIAIDNCLELCFFKQFTFHNIIIKLCQNKLN